LIVVLVDRVPLGSSASALVLPDSSLVSFLAVRVPSTQRAPLREDLLLALPAVVPVLADLVRVALARALVALARMQVVRDRHHRQRLRAISAIMGAVVVVSSIRRPRKAQ
jgi:hypothetical protein